MAGQDQPVLRKVAHAAPEVGERGPERLRVAPEQVGAAAASEEEAVARDDHAMPEEGQVARGMAGRSNGLKGEVTDLQGGRDQRRARDGGGVRTVPAPLGFGFVDDHFESFSTHLERLLHASGVVPMAVREPCPCEVKSA